MAELLDCMRMPVGAQWAVMPGHCLTFSVEGQRLRWAARQMTLNSKAISCKENRLVAVEDSERRTMIKLEELMLPSNVSTLGGTTEGGSKLVN